MYWKWIPQGIMLLLTFCAGVGPNEAASHLAEWLALVGKNKYPHGWRVHLLINGCSGLVSLGLLLGLLFYYDLVGYSRLSRLNMTVIGLSRCLRIRTRLLFLRTVGFLRMRKGMRRNSSLLLILAQNQVFGNRQFSHPSKCYKVRSE
jgi:hypothetical protein